MREYNRRNGNDRKYNEYQLPQTMQTFPLFSFLRNYNESLVEKGILKK